MLYPPYIEGTIPSFYGDSLTVPFSMNKAVGAGEVQGFSLKIKTIQNTKYLFTTSKVLEKDLNSKYYVKFDIKEYKNKLVVGQHYKVQIAYIGSDGVGYYSTVGIVKYTEKPKISIDGMKAGRLNSSAYNYIGRYSQENGDISEKEYKYNFIFTDDQKQVIKETGWTIHNSSNDDKTYLSTDEFSVPFELDKNKTYYLQYKVITNNKLEISTPKYRIAHQLSIEPDFTITLNAAMNQDNGYVTLTMEGETNSDNEEIALNGAFLISRACEDTNFKQWDEVLRFKARATYPSQWSYKDFTVQQGKRYVYSFQQYNDFDIYSDRILSNVLFVDFEDMFLYDGKKQLKIAFNPQVSSFKTDILETKTDTIGSKYPFFFRNGTVEYKEFGLNGLISYLSDEERLFMTDAEMGMDDKANYMTRKVTIDNSFTPDEKYYQDMSAAGYNAYTLRESYADDKENREILDSSRFRTTQLTGFNMSAERTFKLKVLEWLNNGEPKLFRSPGEGNYIVRLMNVSLSPEDTLGRMLHSFSCTAYEVDEYNYEKLNSYGITTTDTPEETQLKFKTITLDKKNLTTDNLITNDYAVTIRFEQMRPGDEVKISTEGGEDQIIVIGATGTYLIDVGTKILSAAFTEATVEKYKNQTLNTPMVSYSYYDSVINEFSEITAMNFENVPAKQFIGEYEDIISTINNIKNSIVSFYYLHFLKRDVVKIDINGDCANALAAITEAGYNNNLYLYQGTISTFGEIIKYDKVGKIKELEYLISPSKYYIKTGTTTYEPASFWDRLTDYYIQNLSNKVYFDLQNNCNITYISLDDYDYLKDYYTEKELKKLYGIYDTRFAVDDSIIDLSDSLEYSISGPCLFGKIELTSGILLECGYNLRVLDYTLEDSISELQTQRKELDTLVTQLYELMNKDEGTAEKDCKSEAYDLYINEYLPVYNAYIEKLTEYKTREDS